MRIFDQKDLENLQKLCKIRLTESEQKVFHENLKKILTYMDQLDEIDTSHTPACNYVLKDMQQNVMRDDIPNETLSREEFLSNAPDQIGAMIRVPSVMKQS